MALKVSSAGQTAGVCVKVVSSCRYICLQSTNLIKYKSNNKLLDWVIHNLEKQNSLICVLFYDSRVFILSLNSLENVLCY